MCGRKTTSCFGASNFGDFPFQLFPISGSIKTKVLLQSLLIRELFRAYVSYSGFMLGSAAFRKSHINRRRAWLLDEGFYSEIVKPSRTLHNSNRKPEQYSTERQTRRSNVQQSQTSTTLNSKPQPLCKPKPCNPQSTGLGW